MLLDGKEVSEIDCLLCLVNTGLLSHTGNYRTKIANLSPKTKKKLIKKLHGEEIEFLQELCSFSLLMALDKVRKHILQALWS